MDEPRPEIEICRQCRYDISDRPEICVVCPECGCINNRGVAEQQRRARRGIGAWRPNATAWAALIAAIVATCVLIWVRWPLGTRLLAGAALGFLGAMCLLNLLIPVEKRLDRLGGTALLAALCAICGSCVALLVGIALVALKVQIV